MSDRRTDTELRAIRDQAFAQFRHATGRARKVWFRKYQQADEALRDRQWEAQFWSKRTNLARVPVAATFNS